MGHSSSSLDEVLFLQKRIRECEAILSHAPAFADARWLDHVARPCFADEAGASSTSGPHVVNTSNALSVLTAYPSFFHPCDLTAFNGFQLTDIFSFYVELHESARPHVWASQKYRAWSPYVSAAVLTALARCTQYSSPCILTDAVAKHAELPSILKKEAGKLAKFLVQWAGQKLGPDLLDFDHPFFAYSAVEALCAMISLSANVLFCTLDKKKYERATDEALKRFHLVLHQQLACQLAGLARETDVASLALSLYVLSSYPNGHFQISEDIQDVSLKQVFVLQQQGGLWQTATPLLGAAAGRAGFSSIELASCLLRIPRSCVRFKEYIMNFDRVFDNVSGNFHAESPDKGWPLDIRRDGRSYQTWYSFRVFEFVALYVAQLKRHLSELVLGGFRVTSSAPKLRWSDIGDFNGCKEKVTRLVIEPWKLTKQPKARSIILFGPPGTGKTSFAHAIAYEVGCDFIEIGPGDFLSKGVDGFFAQADIIFEKLLLLRNVLVLFDELEEFVSVRSDDADKMSKLFTTCMLPWLQRLRERCGIVFIFATNKIELFDPAVKRPGRFDLVVPLGPPQGDERLRIIHGCHSSVGRSELSTVLSAAPEQATIGEIMRALQKVDAANPGWKEEVLTMLEVKRLIIEADQWSEFKAASAQYV